MLDANLGALITGVLLVIFGPIAVKVLERAMGNAPTRVWRVLAFLCVAAGWTIGSLNDPVKEQVKLHSSAYAFVTTLVLIAAALLVFRTRLFDAALSANVAAEEIRPFYDQLTFEEKRVLLLILPLRRSPTNLNGEQVAALESVQRKTGFVARNFTTGSHELDPHHLDALKVLLKSDPALPAEQSKPLLSGTPPDAVKPALEIHKLFGKLYRQYKDRLGLPIGEAEPIRHAYLAQYDKAQIIWDENASRLYRLHMRSNVWESAPDFLDDDLTWYDDKKNSERFGAPEGKLPPWGGPARLRVTNRKDWEIGWRHWHFYHVDGTTFVQRFEKGLIIGPFRLTPSNKEAAQVYALTGDGTDNPEWHTSVTLGVSGLHCVEPMDLVRQPDATLERPNDKAKASLTTPELQTSDPSRQEKVDGWREMIAEAQSKFKSSGLSLIAILEQDSRFESFRRHLSTGALQALTSGTGVRAKDLRSFDDVITMLEEEIIRVEENWGLR